MSATRSEITRLGEGLIERHRTEALALASMLGFFYHAVPPEHHEKRDFHMHTLWTCINAEMHRVEVSRAEIMAAGEAIKQANDTVALLELLTD